YLKWFGGGKRRQQARLVWLWSLLPVTPPPPSLQEAKMNGIPLQSNERERLAT
ncbi:hypothetical protein J4Q44_G00291760, partial [Coregonus suidteri]